MSCIVLEAFSLPSQGFDICLNSLISCKNQVVISEIEKSKYGKTAERNKKDNSNIAKRELGSLGIVIVLRS